jgi:GPH family glycoside/pentoside/hexuronide:cation symporter
MSSTSDQRLPWWVKLLYGSGDFGFAFVDTCIAVLFAIFLTDVVGLKPGMAALAILIGRSWDYVNDPIIGHLCDRTRTRWGRRRPYLLFGFIPFGLAFAMLWWIPPFGQAWALVAYYAFAYLVYDTVLTFVTMPYFALTPELSQDYDERTSISTYRMAFSLIGSLVAIVVPLMIIGTMRPGNANRIFLTTSAFAVACALPLLLAFASTRERKEYIAQDQPGFLESLRAARGNRPFVFAMGIFLFTWTAVEIIQVVLLYFLKYRMNLEAESDIVAAAIFVTALFVLPFWAWVSDRTDKRKAYVAGMIFLAAVMMTLMFVSPSLGFAAVIALAMLAGVGVSAVHVLTWAIIPDAIEVDELATGARHEGMFYALVTLFKKVASSIAVPLSLLFLEWSGFVSNAPQQGEKAVWAIRVLIGPIPSALLVGGILFALFYPLSREAHARTREALAARQAAD